MVQPSVFFDLDHATVRRLFDGVDRVWDLLPRLSEVLASWLDGRQVIDGEVMAGAVIGTEPVFVAAGARIEPGAYLRGPAYVGPGAVIRHGAYVRQNCILLDEAVLGHASEMKNSVMLPKAKAPHFAYVGDSILGNGVNLGAGTKLSNLPITAPGRRKTFQVEVDGTVYDTGLTKLGAILGDDVQTGCNVVVNPGTLLGRGVRVYPNTNVRGHHGAGKILKLRQNVETAEWH
ncbi:hypothetical protein ACFQ05_35850 [Amycolatopsis umgeniensis]|uniref:NDP-sugar pyrophosphorylase family protein n=1 Tax=Amycolatopsis umgeniensis TaxID=336628 RepID=A0A841B8N1_9PSEU|nr:hypothetical protein [Amycolatopsis umgeniensis]MBB5855667.1 NDP-sugar pyrophosphorylase family protein [Amycolatopsis umgeniensis]